MTVRPERLIITHHPERVSAWDEDAWEFMDQRDMIIDQIDEPATALAPARTVLYHRPWTPRDWEDFEALYSLAASPRGPRP